MSIIKYKKKFILVIISIIISMNLNCTSPAMKHQYTSDINLSPRRAMNINWSNRVVALTTIKGEEIKGVLEGWSESGFIIDRGIDTDTVLYDDIRNYIMIQTGENNKSRGAKYGLYSGLGLAAFSSYMILKDMESNDDNPERTDDNAATLFIGIVSAPFVVAISTGIGALIGSFSRKYEKYYFNSDEFAGTPHNIENHIEPPLDNFNIDN